MTNGKRKGKSGELELSKELTRLFGHQCRRGQQYSGIGGDDVVGVPGCHLECKRTESINPYKAIDQAVTDADDAEVPLVCHRRNRREWLAIVRLDDLPELCRRLMEGVSHCHSCGEPGTDVDLQSCAACSHLFCDECVAYRCAEYDPVDGDYFCDGCCIEDVTDTEAT